ncbi:TolC family outer membrane protein [Shewanella surugensis]|uniref:TolC family outer membrane protein n=1 Tax=Shewanella surugensis TaxID=212020 RepID=A0ABT0LIA6_9GAMM|nr:TolC family outer membrane protein [Shewanella surugensis]MCL1127433.1 TolC family outer membrane protein [Shewanella surugensis]
MKNSSIIRLTPSIIALAVSSFFISTSYSQTLEQAVAHTLESNPNIRIVFNQFKASQEVVKQAEAGFMPTLDVTGGYGFERTNSPATRSLGNSEDYLDLDRGEFGVSIQQIIFDGFYTTSEVDRTRFEASAEQWALFAAAEDMALDTSQVYINYIQSEQVLTLAEKNLITHQNIYDQIRQRTDSGLASTADLSQITGRLARANANVISAINNFYDAKSEYIRIVELPPEGLIVPVPDADMLPIDLVAGVIMAQEMHPILKSATKDIQAAESQKESAKSGYYPKFTFEFDGSWDNNLDGVNGDINGVQGYYNELVGMIRVKYNLFAGGKDLATERKAAYSLSESKEIRQRAERQIVEGLSLAWNAYELLTPQKMFIKEHVIAAKETQLAYRQQFNLGQRTLLDLLDTENELFEARKDYLTAEYAEIMSQYRLLNATGQLLGSLRVTRPEVWLGDAEYVQGSYQ